MPFIKISGLTTATAVSATNQFEINQNGGSRSATVAQVATFARTSATDPVVLPAGTASAPSLTFSGDTNTGIYSPAADTIAFTEGGTEAMRIDASGNVGIGTSSPGARLEVAGFTRLGNYGGTFQGLTLQNNNNSASAETISYIDAQNNLGTPDTYIFFGHQTDGGSYIGLATTPPGSRSSDRRAERMRITSDGEVYIAGTTDQGAYNLQCNGTGVWGAGAYVNGSDARIKDDIAPLTSGLDVVAKLKPVQFRYKKSWSKDTSLQPGFIAQDLQTALADQPYVDGVVLQGPEYMSVAYQTLIPLLTKAIQEQQAQIEELKARVAALENK